MSTHLSAKELRNMQPEDLRKEIAEKRLVVAKMHIEIEMRSEKDTARFLREKKELARLLTVQNEQFRAKPALKEATKSSKVLAPAKKKKAASSTKAK